MKRFVIPALLVLAAFSLAAERTVLWEYFTQTG